MSADLYVRRYAQHFQRRREQRAALNNDVELHKRMLEDDEMWSRACKETSGNITAAIALVAKWKAEKAS